MHEDERESQLQFMEHDFNNGIRDIATLCGKHHCNRTMLTSYFQISGGNVTGCKRPRLGGS